MAKHTIQELQQWQMLPLSVKVRMTEQRLRDWINEYGEDGVYVSFSGGKDSTVLLDIARNLYTNLKAVFVDTGLEYPEIREFVKGFDNVDWLKPKMTFKEVINKYGYPFISKEVSECVSGARKYLTSILNEETLTSKQASKQATATSTINCVDKENTESTILQSRAEQRALSTMSNGGYDNKYRKLKGIGEYANKNCNLTREINERQSDKGEYP